ncbi:MAG: hypothetical protein A2023_02680 [Sulfuricurvum sp. GWF2_44_89]|uniref:DUF2393 domain-containing protein n=1 Tax=Sulfuricurvum kujiense TaxID=148813 RepID=A0A2D3WGC5_9BACT|nr:MULTISPECIES: DUF2393 family protein [Sulfuricurvum]OHD77142.1 MAG: hypothetical protein A2023_02680 [Sulfuricurvum sp. GWF2_44_89]OHD95546.1 MAG: hypothetical protein A2517_08715 [Sulfuricurvum sp. RIFOXYD12_FULL_44_77]OHE00132.1 MAG: hypothetical protein A2552_03455 [Sulfuricurvum sp. RIFOXYD2_FULL_44_160]DAB38130.1 MAG TPA: hypothetical protein CFH83_07505 [Sulfuricurvum kujiense]
MSPLTIWHYLLLVTLGLLFIIGILVSMRTNSKFSILTTISLILLLIGIFAWKSINENVYRVEISNLDEERYYQSEQIVIKGTVRNVGNFPVANVVATVMLSNSRGGGGGNNQQSLFTQPSVFAELYKGDDPDFKTQNVVEEHVIAEYLNPGKAKSFTIMMDYPSHFKRASFDVTAKVN